MVDIIEIYVHWYAGRSKSELAASLGVDRKTVRKYLAPGLGNYVNSALGNYVTPVTLIGTLTRQKLIAPLHTVRGMTVLPSPEQFQAKRGSHCSLHRLRPGAGRAYTAQRPAARAPSRRRSAVSGRCGRSRAPR